MVKKLIVYLFPVLAFTNLSGQDQPENKSVVIKISLPKHDVKNNQDLNMKVVIINTSQNRIEAYKWITEGDEVDIFANVNLMVEKRSGSTYRNYFVGTLYQPPPFKDTVDNIPKVSLAPGDSVINYLHLDNRYVFEKGNYRLKCIYRNNILKPDKVESQWLYFRSTAYIFIKKYY